MARWLVPLAALMAAAACGERGGGSAAAPFEPPPPPADLRRMALETDRYLVHYGPWDDQKIRVAQGYEVVIVHPAGGRVTREQVARIQGGGARRVLVLAYLSIGEDERTFGLTDDQMRADPRFRGDGTGPRMDPRGPGADGGPLDGLDPLGLPSNGGTGFASWYLDDNSVHNSPSGVGDGRPDRNAEFGGCFVNAGDPAWFEVLRHARLDAEGLAGLREILTRDHGRGLGCDGVFLDTVDTCAPNLWTDASSFNQSEFEWTAPGFSAFMRRLRQAYPDRMILQNRGLFFFDPRHPHYRSNPRGLIDFVLFESYRLDNHPGEEINAWFYNDNRHETAPKLMAEANRPDGFRVLSLGYAEGPPDRISQATLLGESTVGLDTLLEDIRVTQDLAGFRHYITDRGVALLNTFVRDHSTLEDREPPAWTSTYNGLRGSDGSPAPPVPRVGLQEVEPGPGRLTVRWDAALDLNRVRYALYVQAAPFDFGADPSLSRATRVVLEPRVGKGYADGVGPATYANEATVGGLTPGVTYHLVLRAFDASPAAHEERNTVVLTAVPR